MSLARNGMISPTVPDKSVFSLPRLKKSAREAFLPASDTVGAVALSLLLLFTAISPFLYGIADAATRRFPHHPVEGTGNLVLELLAFGVAAAAFLSNSRLKPLPPLRVPLAALTAVAGFGVVQLLPLPAEVLRTMAPENFEVYHETGQILAPFGRETPQPRISIAPGETARAVLHLLSFAALFLGAAILLDSRARRRLFVGVAIAAAIVRIILEATVPSSGTLGAAGEPRPFAGYLQITLALAFGTLWSEVLLGADRAPASADKGERFEMRFVPLAARFFAWGAIAVGIGWTQSRVGILSGAIATLALFALAVTHRRIGLRRRFLIGGILAVLSAALFGLTAVGPFRHFLDAGPRELGANWRLDLWRVALQAFREFPLVGSGMGTFPEAFRRVQPREIVGVIEHVHSDFLQLLVTVGTVGASLVVLLISSFLIQLFRGWRSQRHREESAMALAGIGCLLAIGLHGVFEFNYALPVTPAILACALGNAWAAAMHKTDRS